MLEPRNFLQLLQSVVFQSLKTTQRNVHSANCCTSTLFIGSLKKTCVSTVAHGFMLCNDIFKLFNSRVFLHSCNEF